MGAPYTSVNRPLSSTLFTLIYIVFIHTQKLEWLNSLSVFGREPRCFNQSPDGIATEPGLSRD
jgi:hypothetical protein